MSEIMIKQAHIEDMGQVVEMVARLLKELEPETANKINPIEFEAVYKKWIDDKIWAFIAQEKNDTPIGLITLHECVAIYAGGIFGEISEMYVLPEKRSGELGQALLNTVENFSRKKGWKRLEVGTPDPVQWKRSIHFYKSNGFQITGSRLRKIIRP